MIPRSTGVGIVVALAAEAKQLLGTPPPPDRAIRLDGMNRLWLSGMGLAAAALAAERLADAGVGALAMFGVAGALAPDLDAGRLICPQLVYAPDGQRYATDLAWRTALQRIWCERAPDASPLDSRALFSAAEALTSPQAKRAARQRYRAAAVDMESAAVAAVAARRGLPFIALRAIADRAGDALPAALQRGVDAWGRPRFWPMLFTLFGHPCVISHLPRLAGRMHTACRQLQRIGHFAGPDLALPRRPAAPLRR